MKTLLRTLQNLLYLIKPYWTHGKLYLLGKLALPLFIAPVLALIDVTLIQAIINAITGGATLNATLLVAVKYEAAWLGLQILRWSFLILYERWKTVDIAAKINRGIYEQAFATDYKYFDDPEFYNNFTFAATEFAAKAAQALNQLVELCGAASIALAMTAYLTALGPWAILIAVAGSIVCTLAQFKLSKLGIARATEALPFERKMAYVHRVVYQQQYAADLKSSNLAQSLLSAFDGGRRGRVSVFKRFAKPYGWANLLNFTAYTLMELGVLAYLIVRAFTQSLGIGAVSGLFLAAKRLSGQLNLFAEHLGQVNELSLYADKIRAFFALESVIEPQNAGASPPDGAFSVELRDASFRYAHSDFALKNLDISIKPGEKIAIVGENGAGKSTLAKLFLRLYDLDSGGIIINGKPMRNYDVHALRRRVGIAFQQPNVYALPLRENMNAYRDADDAVLRRVLDEVHLSRLAGELNTDVTKEFSENGVMLSGGEAQKLGLARLLTGEFGLLLLDEPSSALDPLAEYELAKLMFNRENPATTIMIAHRLSTVRGADRVYLVADGAIAEQGTHDELIAARGRYAEMFAKQAEHYVA